MNIRKRLLYQSQHRGMFEADLLLGGFAQKYLDQLTPQELTDFETLMDAYDGDILNWLYGHISVPTPYETPLFEKLLKYTHHEHAPSA